MIYKINTHILREIMRKNFVTFSENLNLGKFLLRGHTFITLAHQGTWLVIKSEQNANLENRSYLVNKVTRVLSWSKIDKNVLT
jgi:hypothetical protein